MTAHGVVFFCLWLIAVARPVQPYSIIIDSFLRSNHLLSTVMDQQQAAAVSGDFQRKRDAFIEEEFQRGIGSSLVLNQKESLLNEHIMKLKEKELREGLVDPTKFLPARHFFESLDKINESPLFHIISHMPKGGVLHAHDTALCNLDFIIQLTYWDNLWQQTDPQTKRPVFRFSRKQPVGEGDKNLEWVLVKKERQRVGQEDYDAELRKMISLYNESPETELKDVNSIWVKFMEIFSILDGILMYKDAWEAYYLQALKEFSSDEVNYLELRSILPQVSG